MPSSPSGAALSGRGPVEPAFLIFDFDGVVIDSIGLMRAALQHACQTLPGLSVPPFERFGEHMGAPLTEIFDRLGLPTEICVAYRRYSVENEHLVKTVPEIATALRALRDRGARLSLNTGKDSERTSRLLRRLEMDTLFDHVVCSDTVSRAKPHPESVHRALDAWGIPPSRAAMLGDAPNDLRCARAAGVAAWWAGWSGNHWPTEEPAPDRIFESAPVFLEWAIGS